MEFEGLRRNHHTLNLTPLIDIVFLLLVFFMLTAHFVKDESIAIELPEAQSSSELEDDVVEVSVDNQGQMRVDGQLVTATTLEAQLRSALDKRENKWVTLRGDRGANLEQAVVVLDAARKAGAASVDIVTTPP